MAFAVWAPQALDASSQSLPRRGDRVWLHCTFIACRVARDAGNVPSVAFAKGTQSGDKFKRRDWIDEGSLNAQYLASHKRSRTHYSGKEHVVSCEEAEEGWTIFRLPPLLCTLLHIDALQATRWVRATGLFVFASFVLSIRAASASQANSTDVTVVERTCSLKSLDVEAKISSEVDATLRGSANVVDNLVDSLFDGDQDCGKSLEAEANDNILCTNLRRNCQDDQGYTLQDCNIVVYDGYNDSMYKKFEDSSFEGETMRQARTVSSEPQMQTTGNKSSGANEAVREQQEMSVKDKSLEKGLQELSSASYKLVVPLRVVGLRGSVPPIWLKDFIHSQGKRVKIRLESQGGLEEIMSSLNSALKKKQVTPRSILAADVITLGDSWLQTAVSGRLIQPIENAEQHEWFNRLSSKWQAFLRRDEDGCLDLKGLIWGTPYRWGSTVIAFRTDKLSRNNIPGIEDWKDLWRPELTGKIAMVDSSREVVGAVLKSLGASYNTQDFETDVKGGRAAVKQQFLALQKQVKVFDSVHYLKALQSDDVWVAVGWSSDVVPVAKRMSNIRVIAPKSGASLWADLWVIPAASSVPSNKIGSRVYGASPLVHQWFDFCLQPAREEPFKQGVFVGASPLQVFEEDSEGLGRKQRSSTDDNLHRGIHLAAESRTSGPPMDTDMIDGMPPEESLEKSEVLEPLSEQALADYRWLFSQAAEQSSLRVKMLEKIKDLFQGGIKQK